MISKLTIKNYILIKNVEIDFEKGLNVISGETGAGKSIIISSLSFVLGNRSDKNLIMPGAEFCRVDIVFKDIQQSVLKTLEDFGIEVEDGTLIISRKLGLDGKNEVRANGQMINLSMLKNITQNLLEIYGQHAYQILLDEDKHINFVDQSIGELLSAPMDELRLLLTENQKIQKQLDELCVDEAYCEHEKQMLRFELEEIKEANLKVGEDEEIAATLNKMKHTQKIVESIEEVIYNINESENFNAIGLLFESEKRLGTIGGIDNNLDNLCERVKSVRIELDDVVNCLKDVLSSYDFSEEDFETADKRQDVLNGLKRKFGSSIEEIQNYAEKAKEKLLKLENSQEIILDLKSKQVVLKEKIKQCCDKITQLRVKCFKELEQKLISQLETLGLQGCEFVIEILPAEINLKGQDKIRFLFCANKGQKLMPLAKVISGGEMSRFMLAFDVVFGLNKFGTLVFDEIDTGISGEVSHLVATKMYNLSRSAQIIAITHLPSICAMADVNFKVQKSCVGEQTLTDIQKLDYNQNIHEIARLTGVVGYSELALKNAEELKIVCNNQKFKVAHS